MTKSIDFKEEDYTLTDDFYQAIFMDKYGNLVCGEYDMGIRGLDHNTIIDSYDDKEETEQWNDLHRIGHIVRLVPETSTALIGVNQRLSNIQVELIELNDYKIEEY